MYRGLGDHYFFYFGSKLSIFWKKRGLYNYNKWVLLFSELTLNAQIDNLTSNYKLHPL